MCNFFVMMVNYLLWVGGEYGILCEILYVWRGYDCVYVYFDVGVVGGVCLFCSEF